MKALKIFTIFITVCNICYCQKYNESIKKILDLSYNEKLPLETKKINRRNLIRIDNNLVISGLLNNDSAKLYYMLEYYDNDERKNVIEKKSYKFWTVGKFEINNLLLFVYMKVGNDTLSTILLVYKNLKFIDSLCIGFEEGGGETEMMKYKESVITENLEIESRYYEWNPEYSSKKLKENPEIPRTIVTLSDYKIDTNTGKIILVKQEKKYSKCIPEEFSYPNSNCEIF